MTTAPQNAPSAHSVTTVAQNARLATAAATCAAAEAQLPTAISAVAAATCAAAEARLPAAISAAAVAACAAAEAQRPAAASAAAEAVHVQAEVVHALTEVDTSATVAAKVPEHEPHSWSFAQLLS